ncbi:unnamed protein product [Ceutorhynchus assimilis]|uniref:Active regulator of SIRT1 n=1 Tax=Ceutorhynchus assimilis TaxID=467358 RepID=A0A9N9QQA1_9CUCU|nr:unnamed protein product [Ceutorhynchus assimilis]
MSAAIVRQALEIVDPDYTYFKSKQSKKNSKSEAFSLYPEKYKIIGKTYKKGKKAEKIGFPIEKKYTVQEAKTKLKSKKQILEENLRKLKLIQEHSKVTLNETTTKNIIERAVTRRPIKTEKNKQKSTKTAFTEEDFKKFEEEYLNSED